MAERRARLDTFLKHQGIDPDAAVLLAGDASNRRYFRTPGGVLMDAPPELEDVRPFVRVARHLQDLGLSAPEILAEDVDDGWLLLEDLGDDLFSRVLATGTAPEPLYEMAVDVLVAITRHPPPQWLDPYDLRPLLAEADLFLDWYLPAVGVEPDQERRETWRDAWAAVLTPHLDALPVLVLRDCHVDNLLCLRDRPPPANVGLIDFQDALAGHPAYDLASLLDDVRNPLPSELVARLMNRFLAATSLEPSTFRAAFAALSAQRSSKILGIFTRLARRDQKPRYLTWLPATWTLLEHRIKNDGLLAVREWLDRHVPVPLRQPDAFNGLGNP
ncbi:MAG: phosphotransferase [Rhodospirillales bacterium]|nr:phosphotransferase [Rhodospirillales bacterium]